MNIVIDTLPHKFQRYPTVGDWITAHGHLKYVRVSEMGNEDYHFLVALHELIEGYLCSRRGITDNVVTAFDEQFEACRPEGDEREPGHEPNAPYHREHVFAEMIERIVAMELGVDWYEYERTVVGL